jgi:uncharacterized membrane protein YphA (DoxX/SURF4 family)
MSGSSRVLYAVILMAVGVLGFFKGDFTALWDAVPKGFPARAALAYLCAGVSVVCGAGLLWRGATAPAARMLLGILLSWALIFKLPQIIRTPMVEVVWESCAETAVIAAGAWVLYAGAAADSDRRRRNFVTGEAGRRMARVLYGLALIPLGLAHFAYINETAALVPGWLPSHTAWAGFTGCTYVAAGLALLTGVLARPAAALSALQMGMFTLLVWVPAVAAGASSAYQWSEMLVSSALTASAWVVAESCRGMRIQP